MTEELVALDDDDPDVLEALEIDAFDDETGIDVLANDCCGQDLIIVDVSDPTPNIGDVSISSDGKLILYDPVENSDPPYRFPLGTSEIIFEYTITNGVDIAEAKVTVFVTRDPICGDGVAELGETCDDANCLSFCQRCAEGYFRPTNSPVCILGTNTPTTNPTSSPTSSPTSYPTIRPTMAPSTNPTSIPSSSPSSSPTDVPSKLPSEFPSEMPSEHPSSGPSPSPSEGGSCDLADATIYRNRGSFDSASSFLPNEVEITFESDTPCPGCRTTSGGGCSANVATIGNFDGDEYASDGVIFSNPNGDPFFISPASCRYNRGNGQTLSVAGMPGQGGGIGGDSVTVELDPPALAVGYQAIEARQVGGETVTFYDPDDNVIGLTSFDSAGSYNFVGLVSGGCLIARMEIFEVRNDSDDVNYDDFIIRRPA